MSEKKMRVNVTFALDVPILTDSIGRRKSIPDHVAKYIDEYMHNVRIEMAACGRKCSDGPCEADMEVWQKLQSAEKPAPPTAEEIRISKEKSDKFIKDKENECRSMYDMSWNEYRVLSMTEQLSLRELNGVYWVYDKKRQEGKWVKK